MSRFTDLHRRDEPIFGDVLPFGLRSEAFAEDLAGLLAPAPVPVPMVAAAPAGAARPAAAPLAWLARLAMPSGAAGA